MMAVRSPLSAGGALISGFSPFGPPESPRLPRAASAKPDMSFTEKNDRLAAPSPSTNPSTVNSPLDLINPSPVSSSTGTDFTDVDGLEGSDDADELVPHPLTQYKDPNVRSPDLKIETDSANKGPFRKEDEPPLSVIHIPSAFGDFNRFTQRPTTRESRSSSEVSSSATQRPPGMNEARTISTESVSSNATITSPVAMDRRFSGKFGDDEPMSPPHLTTTIPAAPSERGTPRAQTRQEIANLSRPGSSLASILEGEDNDITTDTNEETGDENDPLERASSFFRDADSEINALKTALAECWTLCNTLASLSYIHRERIFAFGGKGDMQEQAWKACWKLCQNLYNTRDDYTITYVRPTLDLCRDFCQALFEVRVRDNETADSVLRVSFELNNHLFNTHDRSLPEAFRERTLDFYITLCHRLMKQKSRLAEETDSLLRACWSLAEMLFSLRQNKREGKKPDEELLGSAIQACWELCDLFREGWTQIRPERATPRPSQTTFTQAFNQARRTGFAPGDENGVMKVFPETPTTIFEDTVNTISPDEAPVPNILVLGSDQYPHPTPNATPSNAPPNSAPAGVPGTTSAAALTMHRRNLGPASAPTSAHPPNRGTKWSSASSVASSVTTASTATTQNTLTTPAEDPTLTLLKTLFVRAAVATGRGFSRTSPDPQVSSLQMFAKNLPDSAFGTQSWQVSLLDNYKKAVSGDSGFRQLGSVGQRAVGAVEVARAVQGMVRCVYGFGWLRDLYRFVFGYYVEEALQGVGGQGGRDVVAGGRVVGRTQGNGNGAMNRGQVGNGSAMVMD